MIEVEVKSFITDEEYERLLEFFKKNAKFIRDDFQITFYFSGERDLRIQKSKHFSKLWLKGGKIHDEIRKEIEVKFDNNQFENAVLILRELGFDVKIVWLRERKIFEWNGIKVYLDNTEGYGKIIELEYYVENEEEGKKRAKELSMKLNKLGIKITPREKFEEKFRWYKENWKSLIWNKVIELNLQNLVS
jgi:predicted adenylyl cyclase CyaB